MQRSWTVFFWLLFKVCSTLCDYLWVCRPWLCRKVGVLGEGVAALLHCITISIIHVVSIYPLFTLSQYIKAGDIYTFIASYARWVSILIHSSIYKSVTINKLYSLLAELRGIGQLTLGKGCAHIHIWTTSAISFQHSVLITPVHAQPSPLSPKIYI